MRNKEKNINIYSKTFKNNKHYKKALTDYRMKMKDKQDNNNQQNTNTNDDDKSNNEMKYIVNTDKIFYEKSTC